MELITIRKCLVKNMKQKTNSEIFKILKLNFNRDKENLLFVKNVILSKIFAFLVKIFH